MQIRDRFVLLHAAAGAVMLTAGLLGLDRVIAVWLHASGYEGLGVFVVGTSLLDLVSGKDISKFLPGLVLLAGALILLAMRATRTAGRSLLFVALVQLLATLVAGVSKNVFGRLRPFELLSGGDWAHAWWVGGSAFPSGHAGFYFGLFLPLAWLFPRWRWPLMLIPWFIAVARVDANHHYLSDVGASIVIVAFLTMLFARLARSVTPPVPAA
jgi:membrane-associated phospholipid phosphatase